MITTMMNSAMTNVSCCLPFMPRKQLAAQFPLLFSPQKSQRFQEDRIAPTTKYALSQLSSISNKEVDDENLNWVQLNVSTPTSAKKQTSSKVDFAAMATNSAKKSQSRKNKTRGEALKPVLTDNKPKLTVESTKPSSVTFASIKSPTKSVSKQRKVVSIEDRPVAAQTVQSDKPASITTISPRKISSKTAGVGSTKQTPQATARPARVPNTDAAVELVDIYETPGNSDSMIVNFELDDIAKTPYLSRASMYCRHEQSTVPASNDGSVELENIYYSSPQNIGQDMLKDFVSTEAVVRETPAKEGIIMNEAVEFDEIYKDSICDDSMFVNVAAGDIGRTPCTPYVKETTEVDDEEDDVNILVGSTEASSDNSVIAAAEAVNDMPVAEASQNDCGDDDSFDGDIAETSEACSKMVLRRSLVLASLKVFISTMDKQEICEEEQPATPPPLFLETVSAPLPDISTADLLSGKIHSRESLENYWESAMECATEVTPMKSEAVKDCSLVEYQLTPEKPTSVVDQYTLSVASKFDFESVSYDVRYDHVKYAIDCKVRLYSMHSTNRLLYMLNFSLHWEEKNALDRSLCCTDSAISEIFTRESMYH
jgi:uncharacterized protein YchJ